MKYLLFLLFAACSVITFFAYVYEYKKLIRVVGDKIKVLRNFLLGVGLSVAVAVPWYLWIPYVHEYKVQHSLMIGIAVVWAASWVWEGFGIFDKSRDPIDTYNRLLGAFVPFLSFMLISIVR